MVAQQFGAEFYAAATASIAALLVYIVFGFRVGGARNKYNIKMPATTGHPDFERVFRIHYNTLEQLPIFLIGLWLFSYLVNARYALIFGLVWCASRAVFAVGYTMKSFIIHELGTSTGYLITMGMLLSSAYKIYQGYDIVGLLLGA